MALGLVLIAVAFGAALAIGRATRLQAPTAGPARVQSNPPGAALGAGTAPAPPPPLPPLKVPGTTASTARLTAVR
jgi:hypothetical protein